MKVGVTGHQRRAALDWRWVQEELFNQLGGLKGPLVGYSALAPGADQLFAEVVIKLGGALRAILPFPDYAETIEGGAGLRRFKRLLAASESTEILAPASTSEESYLSASKRIVDECDFVFAVWDGKPAAGKGGTADVVEYCLRRQKQVVHINTSTKMTSVLGRD